MIITIIFDILMIILISVSLGFIVNIYEDRKNSKSLQFKCIDDTPILSVTQNDISLNFIIDTGSSISAIDSNILKKIKKKQTNKSCEVVGIEGMPLDADVYEIDFNYNNIKYSHTFVCKDFSTAFNPLQAIVHIPIHGLLGCDFFNTYGFAIDFQNGLYNGQ